MMKAWIVENNRIGYWNEIVFAENYKQAKKLALQTELYETSEDFVHMRVRRYPAMDDTENLSHEECTYKLWQSGWMWMDTQTLDPYDEYDDELVARIDFSRWYSWYYKKGEKNAND